MPVVIYRRVEIDWGFVSYESAFSLFLLRVYLRTN
jgi:hypothetical protein